MITLKFDIYTVEDNEEVELTSNEFVTLGTVRQIGGYLFYADYSTKAYLADFTHRPKLTTWRAVVRKTTRSEFIRKVLYV